MDINNLPPDDAERISTLALLRCNGIGPASYRKLTGACGGSARTALQSSSDFLASQGLSNAIIKAIAKPDWAGVEQDLLWAESENNHIIGHRDALYPPLLAEISDAPPLLFVHGQPACLSDIQIAIVGSRNPGQAGARTAHEFARHLAASGFTITSGLALGIDAEAHAGALETGTTIAVTGTGLDRVYPAKHRDLAYKIAENGALVSEFPIGTGVRKEHFPRRNRIISGLSTGTLVVEAALQSGSLITARMATEQGREVFAIPGSIHNPLARGCHRLIREGAKLVETAGDIMAELAPLMQAAIAETSHAPDLPEPDLAPEYSQLLAVIGADPVNVDSLVESSGLTPETISSMLLILELQGFVAASPGGNYSRVVK